MTNNEVAEAWQQHHAAQGSNMYTDGTTIWSYGEHFPMAWHDGRRAYVNKDRYSVTTSKHQRYVRWRVSDARQITTEQLKRVVNSHGKWIPPVERVWRLAGYRRIVGKLAELGVVVDRATAQYGELVAAVRWERRHNGVHLESIYQDREWLEGSATKKRTTVRLDVAELLH